MKIKKQIILVIFIVFLQSCYQENLSYLKDVESETICEIASFYDGEKLGALCSIAIVDSSRFVFSTYSQVYLSDMSGHCIRKIGRQGNAKFEYNLPLEVSSDGKLIYVWSEGTSKFIAYALDGKPVAQYNYNSSLKDFCIMEDMIVIYTKGGDHIIDIYDTTKCEVIKSLGNPSDAHKILLIWSSIAPVHVNGGIVYYMPQDRLEIVRYDSVIDMEETVAGIKSDTFNPSRVKGGIHENDVVSYLCENPQTMLLLNQSDGLYFLTAEGRYVQNDYSLNRDSRYCSLYRADGHGGKTILSFAETVFDQLGLVTVYDNKIYFVCRSDIDDEEVYTLNLLKFD